MTTPVSIRPTRPGDGPLLLCLLYDLCLHEGEPTEHLAAPVLERAACAEGALLRGLVAEEPKAALGLLLWHPAWDTVHAARGGFVTDLYVVETARRKGIGRTLLTAAARHIRADGGSFLWLTSMKANQRAHAFYRSLCDTEEPNLTAFALTGAAFEGLANGQTT